MKYLFNKHRTTKGEIASTEEISYSVLSCILKGGNIQQAESHAEFTGEPNRVWVNDYVSIDFAPEVKDVAITSEIRLRQMEAGF